MTNEEPQDKPKSKNSVQGTGSIHVRPETKKKLLKELLRINKEKDFGRKIKADDFLSLAITLVRPEHIEKMKEASMTNRDRVELAYQKQLKSNGSLSKDEFLGLLLAGKVAAIDGNNSKNLIDEI